MNAVSGPRTPPDVETVYRPRQPLDVFATLRPLGRGPYDPTTQWDSRGVWRTWRTPQGPATLRIHRPDVDGSVAAAAWGPGAEWTIAGLPDLLGCHDDWSELDVKAHLCCVRAAAATLVCALRARASCSKRCSPQSWNSV